MRFVPVFFSLMTIPYAAFADSYVATSASITSAEMLAQVVASTGPTGAMEGRLADPCGDCAFAVSHNKQNQSVQVTLMTGAWSESCGDF